MTVSSENSPILDAPNAKVVPYITAPLFAIFVDWLPLAGIVVRSTLDLASSMLVVSLRLNSQKIYQRWKSCCFAPRVCKCGISETLCHCGGDRRGY